MTEDLITHLSEVECWQILRRAPFGRVAMIIDGEIEIFPINFVEDDGSIFFRTAPGTKLLALTVHDRVSVEVDSFSPEDAWSVVLKGTAEQLEKRSEIDRAETLTLVPWYPTLKYRWVKVTPKSLTGRSFARAAEPARFWG